jgi:RNA polymerase sigma-70 factor (ECF subfamily)
MGADSQTGIDRAIVRAVEQFQAGIDREQSFRFLVDRFYQPVKGFFARRVFSPDVCLDLTQETFLGLYKGLEGYRAEARFEFWLFRIAKTTHLKWLRTRRRRQEAALENPSVNHKIATEGVDEPEPVLVEDETQLEEILKRERLELLQAAVLELPDQMRRCMTLRVYQDLSYREIAELMEVSIDTVKAHLFQARKKLREKLQDAFVEIEF